MKINVASTFNVGKKEQKIVLFMFLQSFFIGVFIATYDISVTSLFMQHIGSAHLSFSFIISGVIGVLFSTVYMKLQERLAFTKLSIINLLVIGILVLIARLGFYVTTSDLWVFGLFVLMGPLNVIALLGFWGVAGRLFSLRQGKRLFGLIDGGQTAGVIIFSFLIPVFTIFLTEIDLLYFCIFSIAIALVVQIKISTDFETLLLSRVEQEKVTSVSFRQLFDDNYLRKLTIMVLLTMLCSFLIYFAFLNELGKEFPEVNDKTVFLSVFVGAVNVFSFLIKVFLFGKVTSSYGVKVSLLLAPVLTGVFMLLATVIGFVFGYEVDSPKFVLFFLLIALTRFFNESLRLSVTSPTFKILYQPIAKVIRFDIHAKIDGAVNEVSSIISGILLVAITFIPFFELIYIEYIIIALVALWVVVISQFYKAYRKLLKQTLQKTEEIEGHHSINQKYRLYEYKDKLYDVLDLVSGSNVSTSEKVLVEMLKSGDDEQQDFAIQFIGKNHVYHSLDSLVSLVEEGVLKKSDVVYELIYELTIQKELADSLDYLVLLSSSSSMAKRIYAAKLLKHTSEPEAYPILLDLLRDIEPEVRKAAIIASTETSNEKCWVFMIDNLSSRMYRGTVSEAVLTLGGAIVPTLGMVLNKATSETSLKVHVIKLLGEIGGEDATELLVSKLLTNNELVLRAVLIALLDCKYRVKGSRETKVIRTIQNEIGGYVWNLMVLSSLDKSRAPLTYAAVLDQNQIVFDRIFLYLSLLHEESSVKKIKENIDIGTIEGIGYALELMDLLISEEIKPMLFPMLEDISLHDKIKALSEFFPYHKFEHEEALIAILNRNPNQISNWTKASAIYEYPRNFGKGHFQAIAAQVFNKEELISEVAIWTLYHLDEEELNALLTRLPLDKERSARQIIKKISRKICYERTLLLSQKFDFHEISLDELAGFAKYLIEKDYLPNEELSFDDCLYVFVLEGRFKDDIRDQKQMLLSRHSVDKHHKLQVKTKLSTLIVENKNVYEFLYEFDDILNAMLRNLNTVTSSQRTINEFNR